MFDLQLALACAKASSRAYDPSSVGLLADISNGIARAIVVPYGPDCIVAFRGTEPGKLADWMADFDALKSLFTSVSGDRCMVHSGFLGALRLIQSAIDVHMGIEQGKVYVTGHSLGGAMAALYAASRIHVGALYTFGQPRTGDAAFVGILGKLFVGNYLRFVNHDDLVPRVPYGDGYEHAGTLAQFDASGHLTWPRDQGATSIDLAEDVREHSMDDYLSRLAICG